MSSLSSSRQIAHVSYLPSADRGSIVAILICSVRVAGRSALGAIPVRILPFEGGILPGGLENLAL